MNPIVASCRMSADDAPTSTRICSRSSTQPCFDWSQYASEENATGRVTVLRSPVVRCTRAYPRKSLIGRGTADPICCTYSCTTSSPARVPVFAMSTLARIESFGIARFVVDSRRFEYAKLVYDRPWPNGYRGVFEKERWGRAAIL